MKKDYTHITLLLDRSGSMQLVKTDTIGGYNQFIKDQQALPEKATYTLVQFDDQYEPVQTFVPLSEALILDDKTFVPRGCTCLLDALGKALVSTGESLEKMNEADRPSKVVFAVMTDGEENSSREFTAERIKEMITHQEQVYGWQVVFLSSDLNAIDTAVNLYGVNRIRTMSYAPSGQGSRDAFEVFTHSLCSYRSGNTAEMVLPKDAAEKLATAAKKSNPTTKKA